MFKDVNLDGKIVKIEFVLPAEIKKFLRKNNIDEDKFFKNPRWEQCIYETLLDENFEVRNYFKKAKLVIDYIHIAQDNQIRVPPESFTKGKCIGSANLTKGFFSMDFSVGYAIFIQ